MSSMTHEYRHFAVGVMVGLAVASVTLLTMGAARRGWRWLVPRVRSSKLRRSLGTRWESPGRHFFIDGVHPPREPERNAQPQREGNGWTGRLESEAIDPYPESQRW